MAAGDAPVLAARPKRGMALEKLEVKRLPRLRGFMALMKFVAAARGSLWESFAFAGDDLVLLVVVWGLRLMLLVVLLALSTLRSRTGPRPARISRVRLLLEKTEELESLALLGVDLVDTLDAGNEDELGLGGNIVAALGLGDASKTDLLTLVVTVLLDVGLGALEDLLTLGLGLLFMTVSDGSCWAMLKVCEQIEGISDPKDG